MSKYHTRLITLLDEVRVMLEDYGDFIRDNHDADSVKLQNKIYDMLNELSEWHHKLSQE